MLWYASLGIHILDCYNSEILCDCGRVQCSALHVPQGLILIGDAAHAVTPVGGQGCNSALEDCEVLDQVLQRSGKAPPV